MAYIRDRKNNPIRKNGAFLVAKTDFTAILVGQWGDGLPSKDLLSQDEINEFFASKLNGYDPIPVALPIIQGVSTTVINTTDNPININIYGDNFRGLTSLTIGGNVIPFFKANSNAIYFVSTSIVGNGGLIVLTNGVGSSVSTQSIAVSNVPFAITGFTPKTAKRGDMITITGTRLSLMVVVRAAGGADIYEFTQRSDTQVSFSLGADTPIGTGVIRIGGNGNYYSTSVDSLSVIATPVVAPVTLPTITSARIVNLNNFPSMEMIGTNLTGVTKITIGGVLVPIFTIYEQGGSTLSIASVRVVDPTHEAVVVTTGSGSTLPFSNVTIFS